ncbi:MAG: VWA domain-containing protein [Nannocystaceae bacterium]|nr:VWA domain-containing protein [Nannocystaceae bacterium]
MPIARQGLGSSLLWLAGACAVPDPGPPPPWIEPDDDAMPQVDLAGSVDLGTARRCDAVDLLFVIDNSGSMGDEQAQLVASFPGFVDGITGTLGGGTDWHVGVITTDDNHYNAPGCQRIGALTTRTGGEASSDAICGPFAAATPYMTRADDLGHSFACAARVGVGGSGIERPMDAIAAAIAGDGLGACNDGFLRDDALLVLVLVTDEDDQADSRGEPDDWYDAVVAAKRGDATSVVVLALVGLPRPNACPPGDGSVDGAETATQLLSFTAMFEHGHAADVCADDYAGFFDTAIAGVAAACGVATVD